MKEWTLKNCRLMSFVSRFSVACTFASLSNEHAGLHFVSAKMAYFILDKWNDSVYQTHRMKVNIIQGICMRARTICTASGGYFQWCDA